MTVDPPLARWRCREGQCSHHQALAALLAPDPTQILHAVVPVLSDLVAVDLAGLYGDGCVLCSRLNGPVEVKIAVLVYCCVIDGLILNVDREAGFFYPLLASLAICQIG